MSSRPKKKKRRRGQAKRRSPDDYFASGPFEFARFGRMTYSRSRVSLEEWQEANARMALDLPKITSEIDALVTRIADSVSRLPPERLLQRAWWEHASLVIGLGGKDEEVQDFDRLIAMRMIDYVQSVIASVQPVLPHPLDVPDEEWVALRNDVTMLFRKLTFEYQIILTAHRRASVPDFDMELEDFRVRAEMLWIAVRGERYQVHERQALEDVISPHAEVLLRLFGIDSQTLADGLDRMLHKLTIGLHDVLHAMKEFREELNRRLELSAEHPDVELETLRATVFEDPDLAARWEQVGGELFDLDLFDVEKVTGLPAALIDKLAWSPGEEEEFFAPGSIRGWPLRVWPTMKRPFIRLGGRVLAFDLCSLFDNVYRVLQRVILRLAPDYKDAWNERQKAVSEALPFRYIESLLPGARILRSLFYRAKSSSGATEWYECDGILIYDDHLFIVEVKAGAFTYTSPATDLAAHVASLQNLVRNPAVQGNRFLKYLESAHEVPVSDGNHDEIARLRRADFRHVTVCAVTLDPFTELAARGRHLRKVGVDIGEGAVWVLSVDDLRVYADLFDNPLVFLHFVEQRMQAAQSELVDLDDELDHLGLYLRENNYSMLASHLVQSKPTKLRFDGYRTPIEEYYSAIARGEEASLPKQQMPARLAEIIQVLGTYPLSGRSEIVSVLLDSNGEYRATIANMIDQQLRDNAALQRARPFSTHGDHGLTLFTWSPPVSRDAALARNHTMVALVAAGETSRLLLELEYSTHDILLAVHWRRLSLAGLSDAEVTVVKAKAAALRSKRVADARKLGKIGPNDSCPCGRGKKYKRCCRPSALAITMSRR
jgi:preprotein translocase subunit SecA